MKIRFEFRSCRRRFRMPLRTARGLWEERRTFLVRLTDAEGNCGYGEVAPVPWHGSETEEEAESFLSALARGESGGGAIGRLPSCRSALDAAREDLRETQGEGRDLPARRIGVAALLPSGEAALEALRVRARNGFTTFKWKIGVEAGGREREIFEELRAEAPGGTRFRLDANGALDLPEADAWLQCLEGSEVEFLEQPLPPSGFDEMQGMLSRYATPIALDESVSDARSFAECHRRGWRGLYVVKPSLFGAMREGEGLLPALRPRVVISSVFETSIGYENVVRWASRWQSEACAAGIGTGEAMEEDGLFLHPITPQLVRGLVSPERVWERLSRDA